MLERLVARVIAEVFGPSVTRLERALSERWRRFRSESWPMAFGSPHAVEVSQQEDYIWKATLAYSYTVAGEFYSGFLAQKFAREAGVDNFVHSFPAGTKLFVRYKPDKPHTSLIRLNENLQAVF